MSHPIDVLIVEDDPMVSSIQQEFINAVEGFRVVGVTENGRKALSFLKNQPVGLMILDIYLPEMDGLETLEQLRAGGYKTGVIIVSASRDTYTINATLQAGAFDYIIKPFSVDRLQASLRSFQQMQKRLNSGSRRIEQYELDHILQLRKPAPLDDEAPKGLNPQMLDQIKELLAKAPAPISAIEEAAELQISRITARRYLEYLAETEQAALTREYRKVGRPTNRYSKKS